MNRFLYIGITATYLSGGNIINQRNITTLYRLFPDKVRCLELAFLPVGCNFIEKIRQKYYMFFFGITKYTESRINREMETFNPDVIFVGSSIFGGVSKMIKAKYPNVKVITFFHNVEYDYARAQHKDTFRALYSSMLVRRIERLAVKHSDFLWGMNERDNRQLIKVYGRGFDLLLPTSLEDKGMKLKNEVSSPFQLLFVGFNFFANIEGIRWFVRKVMPVLSDKVHLSIVGKNMEQHRSELQQANITVVGTVDDLSVWYQKADAVVLPIFSGSGMKTKTAEALMYGKPILSTKEALEGYQVEGYHTACYFCDSVEDFVTAINELIAKPELIIEKGKNAREFFLTNFSIESTIVNMRTFFDDHQ